jgi:hypothetical protein
LRGGDEGEGENKTLILPPSPSLSHQGRGIDLLNLKKTIFSQLLTDYLQKGVV